MEITTNAMLAERRREGWRKFGLNVLIGVVAFGVLVGAAFVSTATFGALLAICVPVMMWRYIHACTAVVQILTQRRWLETPSGQRMKLMAIVMPVLGLGPIVLGVGSLYLAYLVQA